MKFHLYKVIHDGEVDMWDEIVRYADMPNIADREQLLDSDDRKIIALENYEKDVFHPGKKGMLLMDIMEAREDHFPGRYTTTKDTVKKNTTKKNTAKKKNGDLNFDKGDRISQQTMALYIPGKPNNYLICQYNHYGIKASSIASYLSNGIGIYTFDPVLREDIEKRFYSAEKVVALRVKFNILDMHEEMSGMTEHLLDAGDAFDSVIGTAVRMQRDNNLKFMDITMNSGRSRKGGLESIKDFAKGFLGRAGVKKIEATIQHTSEEATEILDLLKQREVYELEDKFLQKTPGMRYNYESRKKAILGSLSQFKLRINN